MEVHTEGRAKRHHFLAKTIRCQTFLNPREFCPEGSMAEIASRQPTPPPAFAGVGGPVVPSSRNPSQGLRLQVTAKGTGNEE